MAGGQPPCEGGSRTTRSYVNVVFRSVPLETIVTTKPITYFHGEPIVIWEQKKVENMIIHETSSTPLSENLYGWPDIHNLRRIIPKQCKLKG